MKVPWTETIFLIAQVTWPIAIASARQFGQSGLQMRTIHNKQSKLSLIRNQKYISYGITAQISQFTQPCYLNMMGNLTNLGSNKEMQPQILLPRLDDNTIVITILKK